MVEDGMLQAVEENQVDAEDKCCMLYHHHMDYEEEIELLVARGFQPFEGQCYNTSHIIPSDNTAKKGCYTYISKPYKQCISVKNSQFL